MDWFERLTGFSECGYEETRSKLQVEDDRLTSTINGVSYGIGRFSLPSLGNLRGSISGLNLPAGRIRVRNVSGDVRLMHHSRDLAGALFQVASQFNMLEMIGPHVTPENGVGIYEYDRTQGPACAIAAGAATIFRNYFVPHAGAFGQTANRQIDGSLGLARALSELTGVRQELLWTMRNGYSMFSHDGLNAIDNHLAEADEATRDALRAHLVVGLHEAVEVTDGPRRPGQSVSQVFCSALPVAYHEIADPGRWARIATLVLEAAYEASLCAAVCQVAKGGSGVVMLTCLGGGAFGNDEGWILNAMRRAFLIARDWPLEVRIVSYNEPSTALLCFAREFE